MKNHQFHLKEMLWYFLIQLSIGDNSKILIKNLDFFLLLNLELIIYETEPHLAPNSKTISFF